jgi:hypothetical protein
MIPGLIARGRSLWRALSGRARVETEMDAEFRHHQELRAEDLVRGGLTPEAARRARGSSSASPSATSTRGDGRAGCCRSTRWASPGSTSSSAAGCS